MTELQAECSQGERIDSFLANRLDTQDRHALVAHLGVCEHCAALLRDLREDERLARIPLTAAERSRIRALVQEARTEVTVRLEDDRRERERPAEAAPTPQWAPPGLALLAPNSRRVLWLTVAAAAALVAAMWFAWR